MCVFQSVLYASPHCPGCYRPQPEYRERTGSVCVTNKPSQTLIVDFYSVNKLNPPHKIKQLEKNIVFQRVSAGGQLMWDLVKTRHGRKHFVKAIKVAKNHDWRTTLASLTVKVADIPLYLHYYLA